MTKRIKKSFGAPDEIRSFDKSRIEVVNLGHVESLRVKNSPGWRWSECVKPIAGIDSCQVNHLIHLLAGRIRVRMDDGSEAEFGPGDVGFVPPGHDAWIVGNEPLSASISPTCIESLRQRIHTNPAGKISNLT